VQREEDRGDRGRDLVSRSPFLDFRFEEPETQIEKLVLTLLLLQARDPEESGLV
jgi:hypothetical protein